MPPILAGTYLGRRKVDVPSRTPKVRRPKNVDIEFLVVGSFTDTQQCLIELFDLGRPVRNSNANRSLVYLCARQYKHIGLLAGSPDRPGQHLSLQAQLAIIDQDVRTITADPKVN